MILPHWVGRATERLLAEHLGTTLHLLDALALTGGSINRAARVDCQSPGGARQSFFVKWSDDAPAGCFEAEREGLVALRVARSPLRIPEPIGVSRVDGSALLVMEFVPHGNADAGYGRRLAEGLASLHATPPAAGVALYGAPDRNFIGPLEQLNPASNSWGDFWQKARITPQLERAWRAGLLPESTLWRDLLDEVAEAADTLATAPSLLHGDLWSGNVFPDGDGKPTLVDPAVYRGDAEVDLAMAQLFGGFPWDFDVLYREARFGTADHDRGVADARTALHQLYPLLVHVNLFGGSYATQAERSAQRVLDFARG